MRALRRITAVAVLIGVAPVAVSTAQQTAIGENQWYLGAHGGVMIFETPAQTRGAIPAAGGHLLVTYKRTGLLVSVDEGFGDNEQSSYTDPTSATGVRQVAFNDIRKYSATLLAFPFKSNAQPYFGVGFGLQHVVNPYPMNTLTPQEFDFHQQLARDFGSFGFGSFLVGVQFRLGRLAGFGQYQITTGDGLETFTDNVGKTYQGRLTTGPTHSFMGGLRIGLGGAREQIHGGSY